MSDFNWTCPHCDRQQTVTGARQQTFSNQIAVGPLNWGHCSVSGTAVGCSNPDCQKLTFFSTIRQDQKYGNEYYSDSNGKVYFFMRLIPFGNSKEWPDYIPEAIREDYSEACLIRDLSPKASATLARRCLQGMIRNFAGITKKTLNQEIETLSAAVEEGTAPRDISAESVAAIDNVRTVGNIGAHMESNVDHIVPVESGEAQLLIDLIENLFDEWYVERHKRQERFGALKRLAEQKKLAISASKSLTAISGPTED